MDAELQWVRPLGFGEARMYLMHKHLHGTTQGAAAVGLRGPLSPERLRAALDVVQRHYQVLRVRIVEREGIPWFAEPGRPEAIPLLVVERQDDAMWEAVLEEHNSRPLPPSALIRAVLLHGGEGVNDHDLLLFVNHAIIDGLAAERLVQLILEAVQGVLQDDMLHSIPPAAEDIAPRPLAWADYVRTQGEAMRRLQALTLMQHRSAVPPEERRTRVRPLHVPPARVRALDTLCSERGASLNSYVSACLLRAASRTSPTRERFALHTAFSMRRLCEEVLEETELGCYLAVVGTFHEVSADSDLHELAGAYQRGLTKAVLEQVRLPREVEHAAFAKLIEGQRGAATFVHDLGYTFTETTLPLRCGELDITRFSQTVNRAAGNVALMLHGMRFANSLYFTLNYTVPVQDESWAERTMAEFARGLQELSHAS